VHRFSEASRDFAEMPTRSLHARGAGATGDDCRLTGLGGITRSRSPLPAAAVAAPAAPLSIAATAGVRRGMRDGAEGAASMVGAGRLAEQRTFGDLQSSVKGERKRSLSSP
jgi:hypothetical protein